MTSPSLPALAALLMIAGCAGVPRASLQELAKIDFATTDLAELRVGFALAETIRPKPTGVRLDAEARFREGWWSSRTERHSFILEATTDPAAPAAEPGATLHVYRMKDTDRVRFQALRQSLLDHRQRGRGGSLGIGMGAREFCRTGAVPTGPVPVTTHLRTSETVRYVVLVDRMDLRREPTIASALNTLEQCPSR